MQTVAAKTIVTRMSSGGGWFGAAYNMNIYRGCSHGCIYCDSRSECYRPGNFDDVKIKANALQIIRDDLRRKAKRGIVATGAMSDPYNPFEATQLATRHALELLNAYGFGVSIATKSPLVERDADILCDIKAHSPAIVKMTVTTADDALCKIIEPYAAPSSARFAAVRALSEKGIYCVVLMMPLLPFINDTIENVAAIVRLAKENGARAVYPSFGMTMRQGSREYYYQQLDAHFPDVRQKYEKRYGVRYSCSSPHAKTLYASFAAQCRAAGLLYHMRDIIKSVHLGTNMSQLSLFADNE